MNPVRNLPGAPVWRLGFWSAVFSAGLALAYIIAELSHLLGLLGPHDGPVSLVLRMTPSLLLAVAFIILMVSIHEYAAPDSKIWSHAGLAFAVVYAVLVSIVYFVELAVVIPHTLRGEAHKVALLIFGPGTFMFAVDILGYGFMSLATLLAAAAFQHGRLDRWIRRAMIANGVLAPAIVLQIFYAPLWNLAALWVITFPLATVLLAVLFKKGQRIAA